MIKPTIASEFIMDGQITKKSGAIVGKKLDIVRDQHFWG